MTMSIRKSLAVALFALLTVSPAIALETPRRSSEDHRVQFVDFSADDVVRVNAANGYITTIIFAPGEKVTNYGSGYSTAWEFATSNNQFFLKPKDKDGTTNLVVVTDKRIYSFDVHLVSNPKNATYKLTFRYPLEEIENRVKAGQRAYIEERLKAQDPDLERRPGLNYNYTMNFGTSEGSKRLAPVSVYDNGRFTYMKFKANTEFPAVYSVSTDGEAIINTHIENEVLVIHGVYPEYRLRAGSDVVGIYNESFNTLGGTKSAPADGTTVQGLVRELKE